ncbi:DUF2490 domain-containing protein [Algoriphagus marinus]|uniref:DUF2490 domain-containing protein n=1 Tax=Algoriphagus marinus TaxID=1925762 RepID=UPI000A8B2623|nr:DUF2490 domain-containing protein [Algoriphagus marinus]
MDSFPQRKVTQISQQWIQSYHEAKLNQRWTASLDGGFRWSGGFFNSSSYIIRGGIGYSILPNLRVATGFAHLGFYSHEKVILQEFRPYQEIRYKSQLGKINLNQRIRIEERLFKDKSNQTPLLELDFNFRFRYSIMFGIPVLQISSKNLDRKIILTLGNEIFLNAGKQASQVFDQNRLIISPTIQWNKSLSVSLTWNSQFASTAISDRYIYSDVFWLQIRHNLDFSKSSD